MSGRISPAAAAKTTPAAKCWIALIVSGPGRTPTAIQDAITARIAGASV
jgi:hypothetical protein